MAAGAVPSAPRWLRCCGRGGGAVSPGTGLHPRRAAARRGGREAHAPNHPQVSGALCRLLDLVRNIAVDKDWGLEGLSEMTHWGPGFCRL